MHSAPELDVDPFSTEFLTNPYPEHVRLRDTGQVVRLTRYGVWAMARHAEVSAALQDFATYCSSRGAGLTDFAKETPWRPPSIILEADPPLHTRTRAVLAKVLSRPALMSLRATMEQHAETLLDEVLSESQFDAVQRLAQAFPLRVFPDAVGIVREGRDHLLPYGDMAFNAFGPRNELFESSMRRASEVIAWITAQSKREALHPDGFGAQIYAEADAGAISEGEAALLVRSLLTAGLDTTIHGIGHALLNFARFPKQWRILRGDPSLVRNAFEEVIRLASPVQTFFRTTTREVIVAGTSIPEGEKVLLFLAAANRDPLRWSDPDRFDIQRNCSGHVGFGYGIHQCVGQMVARMEAEILLGAMTRRVNSFELAGEPVFRLNNTLRGISSLPIRAHRARSAAATRDVPWQELRVARKRQEAEEICSFELVNPTGEELPAFTAGAHVDVEIRSGLTRQYSLCSSPNERHRYIISVLREPASRGGSRWMHDELQEGRLVRVSLPKQHFALEAGAPSYLLLAAGIGITPLISMADQLAQDGVPFELHYCARSLERMAFRDRLRASDYAAHVHLYLSEGPRMDLGRLLSGCNSNAHIYVCGPRRFIDAALSTARSRRWPEPQLHCEFFAGEVTHADEDNEFEVVLARSGMVVRVPKGVTVVKALETSGVHVPVSCEQGVCGTCMTRVLEGIPEHRDSYLTHEERAANDQFTPCCSRARSPRLVLDV